MFGGFAWRVLAGLSVVAALALVWGAVRADRNQRQLAVALADEHSRPAAIELIGKRRGELVPLLLTWAKNPPAKVSSCEFFDGLADAFGALAIKEGIPFLIDHIGMDRHCVSLGPWLKTDEFIRRNLPAVGALVKLGPDASRAVIASFERMPSRDRVPAIFVVSQVRASPEDIEFLNIVAAGSRAQVYWAEEGIRERGAARPDVR